MKRDIRYISKLSASCAAIVLGLSGFAAHAEDASAAEEQDNGGIAEIIGESERLTDITVAIDKFEKIGLENVNNELKEKGVWIFGTAAEGSIPMYKADLTGPAAIVIGNEGDGMSPLVRKNCDVMVHIPMKGRISSLNASAAASILLYEAVRQRLG